jgi:hypothetical protein
MFIHPASEGHNPVQQYPEIFEKYEFLRFHFPGDRMMDFFDSSSFLYGSQLNQDLNMLFSAIQRLYPEKFEDFQSYLKKKAIYQQLILIPDAKGAKEKINAICEEYNSRFGMRKRIQDFFLKYVSDEDKAKINSKVFKPASYKPKRGLTRDDGFGFVIDILLTQRNSLDHEAIYIPFYNPEYPYQDRIKIKEGTNVIEFTSKLTFQDFYEATRKATAKFWLEEYETYLENGGKETIDTLVEEIEQQLKSMNGDLEKKEN